MSMQVAQGTHWVNEWTLALGFSVLGLLVALRARVFRRRSVVGPTRVDDASMIIHVWAIFFIGMLAWMIVPSAYVIATGQGQRQLTPGEEVSLAPTACAAGILALVLAEFLFLPRQGRRRLWSCGDSPVRHALKPALIGSLIAIPWTFLASLVAQMLWLKYSTKAPADHEFIQIIKTTSDRALRLGAAAAPVLVAPIFEEALFRGHLQTALAATFRTLGPPTSSINDAAQTTWPRWAAIVVAAALFTAVHAMGWMWPPLLLLAICLGYAYERTGNLWVAILMHAAFNATSVITTLFLR